MKASNERETDFRKWRRGMGLNQRQAAEKLGLSQVSVHYFDTGARTPKADTRMLMYAISNEFPPLKPWKPSDA